MGREAQRRLREAQGEPRTGAREGGHRVRGPKGTQRESPRRKSQKEPKEG